MSDSSQGPGWWQASDGKWYPPEQAPGSPSGDAGGGTDLGSTLSYAFNKFIQNIGEWVVLWLILVGVFIVAFFVITAIAVTGSAAGFGGGFGFRFNIVHLVLWAIVGAAMGCVYVAIAKAATMAVNGQKIDLAAAFKLTTNNIMVGVVFGLIFGVLESLCWILVIGAFLFLGFMPVLSAMYDKGIDSLSESVSLTTEHSSDAMVWWLIAGLIAGFCGLGAPIAMIGGVYLVKRFRGEAVSPAT